MRMSAERRVTEWKFGNVISSQVYQRKNQGRPVWNEPDKEVSLHSCEGGTVEVERGMWHALFEIL